MNNTRNFDNVPPVANNTVTISTSAPPQVRISTNAQMRPIAVPMRAQPVPIRKIVHDGAPSTSTPTFTLRDVKLEEDDYQASTSSGPLIATSSSTNPANFQQYQRGGMLATSGALTPSNTLPSTSSSGPLNGGGNNSMAMDQPAPVNLASKVAEVFLTAGHAFQKLGDLTLQLHTTTDADESKWSEKEVDNLKNALTRFAHELDQISSCVASRTTKHIKNDIKRRHLMSEEASQNMKRMSSGATGSGGNSNNYTINSQSGAILGNTVPLQQKRTVIQPMGKMVTRTMIPTTRYTVAPISGSSGLSLQNLQNSTVVVSSSSSGALTSSSSPSGMPQLQSAVASSSGSGGGAHRVIVTNSRLPGAKLAATGAVKRVMTPTSGALVLEQHD